jgi:hypothetical protein
MFFKTLTNSYGKVFEVCQRTIDVSSARNTDRAVKQAKRRFEQWENITDWRGGWLRRDSVSPSISGAPAG